MNSLYYQRAITDGSTVVGGATNRSCCAPGGPVSPWGFDGTARTKIVPPVGFPIENPSTSGSPGQWTNADGSGPGGRPVTFLRIERRRGRRPESWRPEPEGRSPEVSSKPYFGEPEIDPVRRRSPTEANQKPPQP